MCVVQQMPSFFYLFSLCLVFTELLSRVLGLEGDECDPMDSKMSVTVFQFAAFFLSIGSSKAIPKSLKQIAQESEFKAIMYMYIY